MLKITFEAAQTNIKSNLYAAMEGARDRLKPEVWPAIQPTFTVNPGAKIFTIGSCFARNIERVLAGMGYDIPTLNYRDEANGFNPPDNSYLNKYTPPSIYDELKLTADIIAAGGEVTLDLVQRAAFITTSGKYIDLWAADAAAAVDADAFLARRRKVFNIFRNAFDADCVTITLGLIEAWYDKQTSTYMKDTPFRSRDMMRVGGDRFEMHVLDYQTCYNYTRMSIELVRSLNPTCKILITTSPVHLNRTFTMNDIITANLFSKSTLRTVCGAIEPEFTDLDYFPSYESAMLTRDWSIFHEDLAHVAESFVAKLMRRLCGVYFSYVDDAREIYSNASHAFDLGDYETAIDTARAGPWRNDPALALIGMRAAIASRRLDEALEFAPGLDETYEALQILAEAQQETGQLDAALKTANRIVATEPTRQSGWVERAKVHYKRGDLISAIADINIANKFPPHRPGIWQFLGDLHFAAENMEEAADAYNFSLQLQDNLPWNHIQLARIYYKLGSHKDAVRFAEGAIKVSGNDISYIEAAMQIINASATPEPAKDAMDLSEM